MQKFSVNQTTELMKKNHKNTFKNTDSENMKDKQDASDPEVTHG